jgi:hypothetical protein
MKKFEQTNKQIWSKNPASSLPLASSLPPQVKRGAWQPAGYLAAGLLGVDMGGVGAGVPMGNDRWRARMGFGSLVRSWGWVWGLANWDLYPTAPPPPPTLPGCLLVTETMVSQKS